MDVDAEHSPVAPNGSLPGQRSFEWKPEHGDILASIAATGTVDTPWSDLRGMLMYQIAEILHAHFRPADDSKPDIGSKSNASNGVREVEELQQQVWDSMDNFEGDAAPFTAQRLAELATTAHLQYKTAAKYLRAVFRVLQVSSGTTAFVADTFALSPPPGEAFLIKPGDTASVLSGNITSSSRTSSSPAASPLLMPIPWLVSAANQSGASDEEQLSEVLSSPKTAAINGHDLSLAEGGSPSLPAVSPTGGRVDEMDPLPPSVSGPQPSGMTETPLPISEPQGSPPRHTSQSPEIAGSPPRNRRPSL